MSELNFYRGERIIILLPIDNYDRREDAENYENETFDTLSDIEEQFPENGTLFFTSMSEFMDASNDQEINLELYWLTYVNVKS